MIERFEVGKSYRWTGSKESPRCGNPVRDWHYGGEMDIVLDGNPHKCIFSDAKTYALFEGQKKYNDVKSPSWNYTLGFENFEEVITP